MTTNELIAGLTRQRQDLWSSRVPNPAEAARIARKLDDLYEQRRIERASIGVGTRADIARRARIEVELERMMSAAP